MAVYYAVLALLTAAVVAVVISAGHDEHGQPSLAGGYDATAPNACLGSPPPPPTGKPLPPTAPPQAPVLGPSFDVKQSGEFVNLSNVQGTLGGQLRIHGGSGDGPRRVTGDVDCVNDTTQHFAGTATPGSKGVIQGTLGGRPLTANLKRDPPDPGTPKPQPPGRIAGPYKLSPRSTCFGGGFELKHAGDDAYDVEAKDEKLGRLS